jgi:hypothetical protein
MMHAPAFQFIRDAGVIRTPAGIAQAANASALTTAESRTFFILQQLIQTATFGIRNSSQLHSAL